MVKGDQCNFGEIGMSNNAAILFSSVVNYYRWNLSVFSIEPKKRVLDLGCGPGLYFSAIMQYSPSTYVATDYSTLYLDQIKQLFRDNPACHTCQLNLTQDFRDQEFPFRDFDYVLLFDVIEHLENDEYALLNVRNMMSFTNSKTLLLRVPALPFLLGVNDQSIGHFRRYTKSRLMEVLNKCSFKVSRIRYQNIMGIIPWFFIGKILKRSLAVNHSEGRIFDKCVPMIKWAEYFIPPPIGLSLYCTCSIRD
jgi:SAM-dependent methyltransferase